MNDDTLLDDTLGAWRYVRTGLISEVEAVPDDGYGCRAHP